MQNIPFEVVVIYDTGSPYEPYAIKPPVDGFYDEVYALKISGEYFPLGGVGDGMYVSDTEDGE